MIKITEQEFHKATGINLTETLPKDIDTLQAKRFIDYGCKIIDRYIRKHNNRLIRNGYNNFTVEQINIVKEAIIEQLQVLLNTGRYYIDEKGLPQEIPLSESVKDILRPLIYYGLSAGRDVYPYEF